MFSQVPGIDIERDPPIYRSSWFPNLKLNIQGEPERKDRNKIICLVTGLNGYIGSNLAMYLIYNGYKVRGSVIDNEEVDYYSDILDALGND